MPPSAESHKKVTPPPQKPAEPPKVKMPETEAELEERRKRVEAAMWGDPSPKKPEPTPVAEGVPAAPAEPPAKVEKEEPKPDPKEAPATKPEPKPEPVDPHALITQTAKEIGKEVGRAIEKAKPEPRQPETQTAEVELTTEDARDAEIISKMEELDPSLKGRTDAFKAFARRRYDYETDWRSKHPGAQFNPDDAEHEEFYKGQPEIDEALYARAERKIDVEKEVAEVVAPIKEKAEAEERRSKTDQAISAHAPKILENVKNRIVESAAVVNPDVAKMLEKMDPLNLSKEDQEQLEETDPFTARFLGPLVRDEMIPMLVELEKSVTPGAEYQIDPEKNKVHAQIAKYVSKFETAMSAKPEKRDGRDFITIADLSSQQDEILKSKATDQVKDRKLKELASRYWTASVDDVQKTIVEDISNRAKKAIDEFDGLARRKYKPEPKKAAANAPAQPATEEGSAASAANGKPRPPSVSSQATVVDTSRAGKQPEKSFGETAVAVHWGS